MTSPTPEAYKAAARALSRVATTHGYRLREEREPLAWAAVDAVWPIAQKAKAAEIFGVLRDQIAEHPAIDTRDAILARLERALRAKIAQEIRAACPEHCIAQTDASCEYELAARIAEGNGDKTKTSSAGPSGG